MLKALPTSFDVLFAGMKMTKTLHLLDDIILSHFTKELKVII